MKDDKLVFNIKDSNNEKKDSNRKERVSNPEHTPGRKSGSSNNKP
jgi:hypothetical protein